MTSVMAMALVKIAVVIGTNMDSVSIIIEALLMSTLITIAMIIVLLVIITMRAMTTAVRHANDDVCNNCSDNNVDSINDSNNNRSRTYDQGCV